METGYQNDIYNYGNWHKIEILWQKWHSQVWTLTQNRNAVAKMTFAAMETDKNDIYGYGNWYKNDIYNYGN